MARRIIIADSDPATRIVMQVKLCAACYDVVAAETGEAALAAARSGGADLFLMAQRLPDVSGAALCRSIRADADLRTVPVVIAARDMDTDARIEGVEAGADAFLDNPNDEVALLARVRSLLRAQVEERDIERQGHWLGEDDDAGFHGPTVETKCVAVRGNRADGRVVVLGVGEEAGALAALMAPHLAAPASVVDRDAVLALAEHEAADVFLIDAELGGWNEGLRLMSELRSRPGTRRAACIILLPQGESDRAATALDLGAADVVHRPVLARELAVRVRTQLSRKLRGDRMRAAMEQGLRLSVVDPLTGLYNRRYGMHHLDRVAARMAAQGRPAGVILFDLDRFKDINDTHGHPAGDHVLAEVAHVLRRNLRSGDLVCRMGGEEFLVVVSDADLERVRAIAERLRRAVAALRLKVGGAELAVTVSAGVASLEVCDDAAMDALGRVDRALYRAKADGRDRVDVAVSGG